MVIEKNRGNVDLPFPCRFICEPCTEWRNRIMIPDRRFRNEAVLLIPNKTPKNENNRIVGLKWVIDESPFLDQLFVLYHDIHLFASQCILKSLG